MEKTESVAITKQRRASKENYRFELLHLFSFFGRNSDKASVLSLYYTAKIFSYQRFFFK